MLGRDALWMELHAEYWQFSMLKPLNHPILALGRHAKATWEAITGDHQRVITVGDKRAGQPAQHSRALVCNGANLTVHRNWRAYDPSSKRLTDALMTQTNAQNGKVACSSANELHGNSGSIRVTRSGRNNDSCWVQRHRFINSQDIITYNLYVCS